MIKSLIKKKKGEGDLIASVVVILAITIFVFFFIYAISDVQTRIDIDQVARKYILRMESTGYLSDADKNAMEAELSNIPAVRSAIDAGRTIDFTGSTMGAAAGYGNEVVLKVSCPAVRTSWSADDTSATQYGTLRRNNIATLVVIKKTTAKY